MIWSEYDSLRILKEVSARSSYKHNSAKIKAALQI